jgi:hypothetical protein
MRIFATVHCFPWGRSIDSELSGGGRAMVIARSGYELLFHSLTDNWWPFDLGLQDALR